MRVFIYGIFLAFALTPVANSAPLSKSELKELACSDPAEPDTQADFQEERMIRLMKKPIQSSGCALKECPAVHSAEEGVCDGKVPGTVGVIVDQIP
jgi:hypothetical protein